MAKLNFSDLNDKRHYEIGHNGNLDLSIFTKDLDPERILTIGDFQELVKRYAKPGLFNPKPVIRLNSVRYPSKPNDFSTVFSNEGLPSGKPNDKLRKVEFFIDFGATNDDVGNNPQLFRNVKRWVCAEEWRFEPTDEKPFHTRIGHTIKGIECTTSNNTTNMKVDIYFREDYLFADPSIHSLHVTYKLYAVIAEYTDGTGSVFNISKDNDYQDAKPVLDYKTGKSGDKCDISLYEAERTQATLSNLESKDFLSYNQLEFVYIPATEDRPSTLFSTTTPILKGNLPMPNYVELDFTSPHIKKNPNYLGSEEEWLKSLVYRFEIRPEHISQHKDLNLPVNEDITFIALTDVPDLIYSRLFPNSGDIDCRVKYGYTGELGNVSSPYTRLKTTNYKNSKTLVDIMAPRPAFDMFKTTLELYQTELNISKYPVFGFKVDSVYEDLNFGNFIEHARDYMVYGKEYIQNVEDIYNERIAVTLSVWEDRSKVNQNAVYQISKSVSVEEFSNHMKLDAPILLEYAKQEGIQANKQYFVKVDVSFNTAPILKDLMLIPDNMIATDIKEFTTAPNVIENPIANGDKDGIGATLDKAKTHDKMSYYGEMEGRDFFSKLNYKGELKKDIDYKFGDEVKLGDRNYAFYQDQTPGKVTNENDNKLRKYSTLGDVAKLPDMKAVFKAMGLSNDNVFNYGLMPYGIRKENDNYPDMEATLDANKTTWIKTMSKANKLLYISKGSYIDSVYQIAFLRRGLFGSGRTYRFGNTLYKIRFLSDQMRSALDAVDTEFNATQDGEFLLYDNLLRGTLANYAPNEIGIETTNEHKDWGNEGYVTETAILNSLPEQTQDEHYSTYFEGNGVSQHRPYKKIVIKGKQTLDEWDVKLEADPKSEFISTTNLVYDKDKREITLEFYNLPEEGMNEWQILNVKLEKKAPTTETPTTREGEADTQPTEPEQPEEETQPVEKKEIKIYLAITDATSSIKTEYEILGQNANRIFNAGYVGHDKRFRISNHEYIAYKNEKNKYGGFAQIVLNAPIVLEEVLPGFEPYNKSITTPGNTHLQYMEAYDIGYYGEVDGKEFFRPSEIKQFLGLKGLNLNKDDDIIYFKVYYHGLICYIPNRTIGKVKVKDLIDKGLVFGFDSKEKLMLGKHKYKAMLFNTSECYDHHKGKELSFKLNETEVGGMFKDLICRLTDKYDKMVPNIEKFAKSSVELEIKDTDILLTKDMVGEHLTENNNNVLVGNEIKQIGPEDEIDYLPIIFIEATDYTINQDYPEGGYGKFKIEKKTETITETYYAKEEVKKLRRVEKIRVTKTYESQTNVVQIPNGSSSIPITPKKTEQRYGLIGYYCSKKDLAFVDEPIYAKTMLDVKKQSGKQTILYSNYFKRFQDYLTKPLIVDGFNGRPIKTAQPYHIHILFDTFLDGAEYIKKMTKNQLFIRVTNEDYKNAYNIKCGDHKYASALAGNTTSKEMVFTINSNYQPNNPTVKKEDHVTVETNITISNQNDEGDLQSSWCSLTDKDNKKIQLPYNSPFVPYEDFTVVAKELINNFVDYLKQEKILQIKMKPEDMCFGFAVVNLDELGYIPTGIVAGSIYIPDFIGNISVVDYFGSRGNGYDFIDIFERTEGTTSKIENVMVPIIKEEKYVEFEQYSAMIDVKKTRQKEITIEQVVYT